jgi:hypothetical protein
MPPLTDAQALYDDFFSAHPLRSLLPSGAWEGLLQILEASRPDTRSPEAVKLLVAVHKRASFGETGRWMGGTPSGVCDIGIGFASEDEPLSRKMERTCHNLDILRQYVRFAQQAAGGRGGCDVFLPEPADVRGWDALTEMCANQASCTGELARKISGFLPSRVRALPPVPVIDPGQFRTLDF